MLGCKTSLNKSKRFEIILCMFSDHNEMKLESSNDNMLEKLKYLDNMLERLKYQEMYL